MSTKRARYAAPSRLDNGSSAALAASTHEELKRIDRVLNDRLYPSAGMDGTYNAAAFPGTTDEAKITRAIAQAAADGVDVVWIPASMLSYDASAVTFNNAVRMAREGQGNHDRFDWVAYGADPTRTNDSFTAIQAATAAAVASGTYAAKHCMSGAGRFKITQPIIVDGNGISISGEGRDILAAPTVGTRLDNDANGYVYGPLIHVGSSGQTLPLTTSLVSGSGNALDFTSGTKWIQLRDASTCDLHGLAAFTVECFYKPSSVASQWTIASSAGTLFSGDPNVFCFVFFVNAGAVACTITTSVGTYTASGGTLVSGTTYHIAGTYDGSNLRVFAKEPGGSSTVLATTAATGTLVQYGWEDVLLGARAAQIPEANFSSWTVPGQIDSFRMSDSARYTGTFTAPSAKFTNDSHTLILLNCDLQRNPLTRAYTKNGNAWLRFGDSATPAGESGQGFTLRDMELGGGSGITGVSFGRGAGQGMSLRRLRIDGTRRGIYNPAGDGFWWRIAEVMVDGAADALMGIGHGAVAGIGQMDTVQVLNGALPFFLAGNCVANNCYVVCGPSGSNVVIPFVVTTDQPATDWVFNACNIDSEQGVSAKFRAALAIAGGGAAVTLNACGLSNGGGNVIPVILSGTKSIVFNGGNVVVGSPTAIFTKGTQPVLPAKLEGLVQQSTFVPWADSAGLVVVGHIGKGVAVTFSATPTFDASLRDSFEITLTGNVTSSTLSKITPGQQLNFKIIQDATGGRTFVWPTNVKGAGTIDGAASHWSKQVFEVDLDSNATPLAPMQTGS